MKLSHALRLTRTASVAFVGGGGKTSAVFLAARELAPALVTTSTHLAARQAHQADRHLIWHPDEPMPDVEPTSANHVTLVTGPHREDIARLTAPTPTQLEALYHWAKTHHVPLFIEADGSRQRPLKAPAEHEPAIPPFVENVVVTAGLRGLDRPLDENFIHRPHLFGALSGLQIGEIVNETAIVQVLTHPQGGLRNIPYQARRVVLFNQADTAESQARAGKMATTLLKTFQAVIIASIQRGQIYTAHERVAGIVLAAGAATRYGKPKQLLDFRGEPFVRRIANTALKAGLWPVIVISGAYAESVEAAVRDLPITIVRNENWRAGQATSLQAGIQQVEALNDEQLEGRTGQIGAAIFLLADQPQITVHVLEALKSKHDAGLYPIVAPLVADRRANPVLFDRVTFAELLKLQGDTGGRAVMRHFPVEYLPWHDESLLLDVDNENDYRKLLAWGVEE
ncbi:MAG: putative selenium-dependent hydroxylase accessory protein YqeC [Anaerolineae bacterium]|nr:MAG: putative selenium-dependent hydroxylase accessory protein YqeC [Anaerolineae bacterium]